MPWIVVRIIRFADRISGLAETLCGIVGRFNPTYGFKCWEAGVKECDRLKDREDARRG
jgi:hypothetical protein